MGLFCLIIAQVFVILGGMHISLWTKAAEFERARVVCFVIGLALLAVGMSVAFLTAAMISGYPYRLELDRVNKQTEELKAR